MLEDTGISIMKLLVVLDIEVYRPIYQYLQPVLAHQVYKCYESPKKEISSYTFEHLIVQRG